MDFAVTDEQEMLRDTARRFLDDRAPLSATRQLMETDAGFDASIWDEIAAQGWLGMAIPEAFGGAGFGFAEQAILLEEMGRSLFSSPFMSSVVLGAQLLMEAGSEQQRTELLPQVATGDLRLAVAQLESGSWGADGVEMTYARDGDELVLDGAKAFVMDGHTADQVIVVVREPGSSGEEGVGLVLVPGDAPGLSRTRVETLDQTRKLAELRFDSVRVPVSSVIGEPGTAWGAVASVMLRASVALAHEQVGGARECLDMAVAYAKERVQFGRPIGSFQAVKHTCADMLVAVESARSAAAYAAWAVSSGSDDVVVAAALATSSCSEAFSKCAGDNIQIHGGVGFTWEHDAHLFFKRAKSSELMFGGPESHRARLGDALGV